MKKIRVQIPASTTNLGPGFDCLGLALKLYNVVEIEEIKEDKVIIEVEGEGRDEIPRNKKNIIFPAIKSVFDKAEEKFSRVRIREINHIPLCKGLGSSAATRLGGIVSASNFLKINLSQGEILNLATHLEGHPDNAAASLLGGLVMVIPEKENFHWIKINLSHKFKIVLALPEIKVSTEKAREILPQNFSLEDIVFNLSRMGALIYSLTKGKWEYLSLATEDKLHQPYREILIPGMKEVMESALSSGAKGAFLSGAGSGIVALTEDKEKKIGESMQESFLKKGIKSKIMTLEIDEGGLRIVKDEGNKR
mgnify:CR=1 FL=1